MSDLGRIEEKIDHLTERMSSVDVTLARQHVTLSEHMRRTEASEARLEKLEVEMQPLTRAHFMWAGVGKLLAVLGTIAAVLGVALKFLS